MTLSVDPTTVASALLESGVRGFSLDDADRVLGALSQLPDDAPHAKETADAAIGLRDVLAKARESAEWQEREAEARMTRSGSCAWC